MAKNKNNSFKNSSKNSTSSSTHSQTSNSMKDNHAQVPDQGPARSGPGGE